MSNVWTVKQALEWTTNHFRGLDLPDARLDAELLLADVLKCKRLEIYLRFDSILTPEERRAYRETIQRRVRREPVQYILGYSEFMGLPLTVSPDVLIPRPETERLIDLTVEHFRETGEIPQRILDIGTGSGCIAIALAKQFPQAGITASEKSAAALQLARQNALDNGVQIDFLHGDFFQTASGLQQPFDLIVSNPPYIASGEFADLQPEVRDYEPREALLAGEDGMDMYRQMAPLLPRLLQPAGRILLETGHTQAQQVSELFKQQGCNTEIARDYNQNDRVVIINR